MKNLIKNILLLPLTLQTYIFYNYYKEKEKQLYLLSRTNQFIWREHYKIVDAITEGTDLNKYMRPKTGWDQEEFNNLISCIQNSKTKILSPFYPLFRSIYGKVYEDNLFTYKFPYKFYKRNHTYDLLRAVVSTGQLTNYINKELLGNKIVFKNITEDIHNPIDMTNMNYTVFYRK